MEINQVIIFFFEFMLINNFFFKTFSIFFVSRPPYLKSDGFSKRFNIVDSTPILLFPPFKIYLILEPNSSFTSDGLTELNLDDIFALGAATG